jgi:hypothetical protein
MSIHHIHMEKRCAALLDRANSFSQAGKISGKYGWSDFNGIVHGFSADILPDSRNCLNRTRRKKTYPVFGAAFTAQLPFQLSIRW